MKLWFFSMKRETSLEAPITMTGAGNSTTAVIGEFGSSMEDTEEMEDFTEAGADGAGRLGGPSHNRKTFPGGRH